MAAQHDLGPGADGADLSVDLWWHGWRTVGDEDVYDGLTIRDQNGLVVRVCSTEAEAAAQIADNNRSELAKIASHTA